jgi:hypothetical protein
MLLRGGANQGRTSACKTKTTAARIPLTNTMRRQTENTLFACSESSNPSKLKYL